MKCPNSTCREGKEFCCAECKEYKECKDLWRCEIKFFHKDCLAKAEVSHEP
jgi:hypothetical protein